VVVKLVAALLAVALVTGGVVLARGNGSGRAAAGAAGTVVWAVGDGADGSPAGRRLARYVARQRPARFLYLGDVYEGGTAGEFARHYDPVYGALARRTDPVLGNHEFAQRAAGYFPYWRRARGWSRVRARHRAYVDASGWQVIAYSSESDPAREAAWVRRQVARHAGTCRIAFGHRGRYARLKPIDGVTVLLSGAGGHDLREPGTQRHAVASVEAGVPTATRLVLRKGAADFRQVDAEGRVYDSGTIRCTPAG
jgi:hypothetical protein